MFEDVRHERSIIILLSLTSEEISRQAGFADHEINIIENLAVEKLHRQRISKESIAVSLMEKDSIFCFLNNDISKFE